MRTGPDNLQVALGLQLHDANFQHFVEQNWNRCSSVRRLKNLRDGLVQCTLEHLAWLTSVRRGCETQFNRLVTEVFTDFGGQLIVSRDY
jgi:hypothetical protein